MTTIAVHHRCITGTVFGGFRRNRWSNWNRIVEPKLANHRVASAKNPAYALALPGMTIEVEAIAVT
jgi:hypothetical protein